MLRNLEDRLERLVEGMFARAFRTGLQPVEIGRRLVKELDANRGLDVHGRPIAPNHFDVQVGSADFERLSQIHDSLLRELTATLRAHAQAEGQLFLGRVAVSLEEDPHLRVGIFRVQASFNESVSEATPPAFLELPDGATYELGQRVIVLGRMTDSDVVIADPNASRQHAELHPEGDSYVLVDLGSTNGSRVNGVRIERQLLRDGDELTFGTVALTFRLL